MAAPEYVPVALADLPRPTEALPPDSWRAERPGDLVFQPRGPRFGTPGPDQGYGLKLAKRFVDQLQLQPGEHADDVVAGGLGVGLKRAAIFGRAPVIHDFELAYGMFGFLDEAPADLVEFRTHLFAGAAHHYWDQREICDTVPDETLPLSPAAARARVTSGEWRSLLREPPPLVPPVKGA
ncbi:MAG: hypothetical protein JWO37_2834 [Acidimicrobiales bacterium]|jgi:hypothetical protein|nr:hypothetical protein [Acidimicrobiales bacterium]